MIDVGIVDDDALVRHVLTTLLNAQSDISVAWTASDGEEVIQLLDSPENSSRPFFLTFKCPEWMGSPYQLSFMKSCQTSRY